VKESKKLGRIARLTGEINPSSEDSQEIIEASSSEAVVALTNRFPILKLKELFEPPLDQ
jgi:hypothetical protein